MIMKSRYNKKNDSLKRNLFNYLLTYPILFFTILSIPRIVAAFTFSNLLKQFPNSYLILNLNAAIAISAIFLFFRLVLPGFAKIFFQLGLSVLFVIRALDIELNRTLNYSFSPNFFAHIELESFKTAIGHYWFPLAILVFVSLIIFYILNKSDFRVRLTKSKQILLGIIMLLLLTRSVVVLEKQRWRSSVDFASQLFIEQFLHYDSQTSVLNHFKYTEAESKIVEKIGFELSDAYQVISSDVNKRNVIFVILKSMQSNFTKLGGSKIRNLTPNLDQFATENLYFPNFYNAVNPTINAYISSQCGLLPEFNNNTLDKVIYAPNIPCVSDILNRFDYHQMLVLGAPADFSGMKKFARFHQYDEVYGKKEIIKEKPGLKDHTGAWGISDLDTLNFAFERLQKRRKSGKAINLNIFTIDTLYPYFGSRECPVFKTGEDKLNAIHCLDYSIGVFLKRLKQNGYFEDSAIILMGDHMMHGGKNVFGKVYMAMSVPGYNYDTVDRNIFAYTPDVAPTILDLLGLKKQTMIAGKSLLNKRKNYQHLVANKFDLFKGKMKSTDCNNHQLEKIKLQIPQTNLTGCQRLKVISFLNKWVLKQ